jgi:hypothetical protein
LTSRTSIRNPFYVILIAAGTAFLLTACAYAVMMLHANRGFPAGGRARQMLAWLNDHGGLVMGAELAVLLAAAVVAAATDAFWTRRAARRHTEPDEKPRDVPPTGRR